MGNLMTRKRKFETPDVGNYEAPSNDKKEKLTIILFPV